MAKTIASALFMILGLFAFNSCRHSANLKKEHSTQIKMFVFDESFVGIPAANLILANNECNHVFRTDLSGHVELSIEPGAYEITVSATGYMGVENAPCIINNREENIQIQLSSIVGLDTSEVNWEGGWMTIINDSGNFRSITIIPARN